MSRLQLLHHLFEFQAPRLEHHQRVIEEVGDLLDNQVDQPTFSSMTAQEAHDYERISSNSSSPGISAPRELTV